MPADALRGRPHAGADADRPRRRHGPRRRDSTRAPTTTSSSRSRSTSCWRACGRCCAARARAPAGRPCASPTSSWTRSSHQVKRGDRADRADAHGVRAAGAVPAPSAPGADPAGDLRARLGLRLRPRLELARGLRELPAAQDRGRAASRACCTRCAASATCCARNEPGLRRIASIATRCAASRDRRSASGCVLLSAAAVAVAVVLASGIAFLVVRNELRGAGGRPPRDLVEPIAVAAELLLPGTVPESGENVLVLPSGPLGSRDGYAQIVRPDGTVVRPRGARIELPVDQRVLEVASGRPQGILQRQRRSGACTRVSTPRRFDRRRRPGRATARGRGPHAAPARCSRSRSSASAASRSPSGSAWMVARAALTPVKQLTDAAEHVARTRDLSRRIEADGTRRAQPARRELQHDARGARRAPSARSASSSPTPRTSCARRSRACARTSRCWRPTRCSPEDRERLLRGRGRAARRADGAGQRPRRPRARRRAGRGRRRTCAWTCWSRERSSARAATRRQDLRHRARAVARRGRAGPARPGGQRTCSTTPRSGARPGGQIEVTVQRRRGDRARPRPGHRRLRPAVRVRPLLPRAGRARAAGLGARPGDRAPGRGVTRRRRWCRARRTAAARAMRLTLPGRREPSAASRLAAGLACAVLRIISDTHMTGGRRSAARPLRGR